MMRSLRLARIMITAYRFGLDEVALSNLKSPWLQRFLRLATVGRNLSAPRAVRLRLALEDLGPIFVKFGQVLSTRRDLLPPDIADELAKLQDRVPPFPRGGAMRDDRARARRADRRGVRSVRRRAGGQRVDRAGALRASLLARTAREVAVKVLRPGMLAAIDKDLALLRSSARAGSSARGATASACKPREVVAEFDKLPARRARPGARGRQRRAAAPQHGQARTCCVVPGDVLGLLQRRR